MKKTILNDWHRASGASMVDFGGWDMPVSYTSLSEEHKAVRSAAGLFDVSHMGQVRVRGPKALDFLQWVTTNDVSALGPGRMQYSLLPDEQGGLHDDIIVSHLDSQEGYFVVVNASNTESDLAWMKAQAGAFGVQVEHLVGAAMLALQGPLSEGILQPLTSHQLPGLRYYHLLRTEVAGAPAILSRSGYTGEDGFEICLRGEDGPKVWEALMAQGLDKGLKPIGLGARNTLRLEMAYPLYGHEISHETNPLEAGLGWVIKGQQKDFVGKQAIASQQLKRKLVGFEMLERGVGRDGYAVLDQDGRTIGQVSSASPSPTLNKNIGLAYVPNEFSALGSQIFIDVRGKGVKAVVVKTPFAESHVRKNK
jgi:aminomethyltransferase